MLRKTEWLLSVVMVAGGLWACGDGGNAVGDGDGAGDPDGGIGMPPDDGPDDRDGYYVKPHDYSGLEDQCGLDTGYLGDILCLKAPEPEDGFQLHLGPTNYDDPVEVEEFLLDVGVENNECFYVTTPNDQLATYYERLIHMRPTSHHVFLFIIDGALYPDGYPEGWAPCGGFAEGRKGSLGGAEVPRVQYPPNGVYAPENMGIGRAVSKNTLIKMEMHAINTTDEPLMREMWANVIYKPKESITESVIDVNVLGGFSVATQPGDKTVMDVSVRMTQPKRILNLFGHMHAHGVRFSAWRTRGDEKLLLLEDYDWFDPRVFTFDSVTENSDPNPEKLIPGATSGILNFEIGDSLDYQCEVWNDSETVLRYRNEVETGEMCNIFGEFVGNGADLTVAQVPGRETVIGTVDE
jgi:hypothetical protein